MRIKQWITTTLCVAVGLLGAVPAYAAYAENKETDSAVSLTINGVSDLAEIEQYLQQFEGEKIKLTANKTVEARETLFDRESEAERQNKELPRGSSDQQTHTGIAKLESKGPILREYQSADAKKVYSYSEAWLEKIQDQLSLEDEFFIWEIPIVTAASERGVVFLEKSQETEELIATAIELPVDNRKTFLSNKEIVDLIHASIDPLTSIEALYFADMPLAAMGRVLAVAVLDSGEVVFATIEDVPYYNGMEFRKVYTFAEMMAYLELFDAQMGM